MKKIQNTKKDLIIFPFGKRLFKIRKLKLKAYKTILERMELI